MTTKILIVDDEANIRRMVGALLKSEEFEVAEAANGNAALLAIPEVHPDIILLDLMMPPGPDGLATLERIRAGDRDIPVIMMSGKAQLADAVRAVQMGAFQFLEKAAGAGIAAGGGAVGRNAGAHPGGEPRAAPGARAAAHAGRDRVRRSSTCAS